MKNSQKHPTLNSFERSYVASNQDWHIDLSD